ncbi:hypothetical protein [Catellatospora coxensis]|uniref:hypothetical protein n=1 Tax=Catellatospora coxensis TaxID=310354 RepID=UPI00194384F3|nr:hypothetical protein [Catellatospora coxensis]
MASYGEVKIPFWLSVVGPFRSVVSVHHHVGVETRADFALELQLQRVDEIARDHAVKAALSAVHAHLRSGGRRRRAGQRLVMLLGEARHEAAVADEWQVVRLLQDSIDYVEGRIIKVEFEERYRLFRTEPRATPACSGCCRASRRACASSQWSRAGLSWTRNLGQARKNC